MIRQLLEEVKAAPLDEASRDRLKEIHQASIKELEDGLAPELVEELERLTLPFTEDTPRPRASCGSPRPSWSGWLEGLFHGIQTAIYAQQMAARGQFEQMRRALPPGMHADGQAAAAAPGDADHADRDRARATRAGCTSSSGQPRRRQPAHRRRPGRAGRRGPAPRRARPAARATRAATSSTG